MTVLNKMNAMNTVRPKKHLGQHFLADPNIARRIVESLRLPDGLVHEVLEIGPGMGVLTQYLLANPAYQTSVVEIDTESVAYLTEHYPALAPRIYAADFLRQDLGRAVPRPGCWPSSATSPTTSARRYFFQVLAQRQQVREVVGMLQKEVAERLAEPPGSKTYGILSVLLASLLRHRIPVYGAGPRLRAPAQGGVGRGAPHPQPTRSGWTAMRSCFSGW